MENLIKCVHIADDVYEKMAKTVYEKLEAYSNWREGASVILASYTFDSNADVRLDVFEADDDTTGNYHAIAVNVYPCWNTANHVEGRFEYIKDVECLWVEVETFNECNERLANDFRVDKFSQILKYYFL